MKVPFAVPYINESELREVSAAIAENWLSMGKRVHKLESLWAEYQGAKHAVAVFNGTIALELALRVMDIGPGDEVIVPAMTYFATVAAVALRGATPVFTDIEDKTYNLNPDDITHRITNRTRAIIYIDYGGNPADSTGILGVARKNGVPVLQDAAESIGGKIGGKPLGFEAELSITSFHAIKMVTTVEGGMIFTNDDNIARCLRILRNQGEDPDRKYHHVMIGYNARMTDMQAAVGLAQFSKFGEIVVRRSELAEKYNRLLANQRNIGLIKPRQGDDRNAWFFYPVLVPNRDKVASRLKEKGVETRIAFPMPVYRQPAMLEYLHQTTNPNCPVTEEFTSKVIDLPIFYHMTEEQQQYVVEQLIESVNEIG